MCRHSRSLSLSGLLLLFTIHCSLFDVAAQRTQDYTRWVNPFIGTGGHGHTFPGATTPFGMVQLSPDTRTDNWDGSSGYHYSDDVIYGFSHTHLSGTGIPDYCDILFMPTVGAPQFFAKEGDKSVNGYASKFSHANEHSEPGYYSVKLDDDDIFAEMTATARVGLHRYTFPKNESANILVDLKWRDKVLDSRITRVSENRIEGYRYSKSWAQDQRIFFVAEFSEPISGMTSSLGSLHGPDALRASDNYQQLYSFNLIPGEQILVKVALSPVSIEGARKNLAAEMPGWDFDKVRADAKAAWNKELSKIEVTGGTDAQRTTFYTALYHTMIQPNIFEDVDGSYLGHDGKVHNIRDEMQKPDRQGGLNTQRKSKALADARASAPSHEYTVFSLWDTFRAAHPLYTIIDQKRTVDFINTFIRQYEQGGRLPVWELAGNETDCMIGYHAVSVIADAMAKGIKGFDYEKAYEAAKHSAELDREGLAAYKKRGYISMEDTNESVSKTLEYAYDDWCIAQIERYSGHKWSFTSSTSEQFDDIQKRMRSDIDDAKRFLEEYRRTRSFENLFDPDTGFMRPKKNGGFVSPFAPNEVTFNYTEGNAWVYTFFVPQDVSRLMELEGGRDKFAAKLDELFTTTDKLAGREQPDITGLIGQYAHGNEPSHHIAYLYDYAGQPWKTQKYVRQILDNFYKPEPDGLIGNEDCGQMSAWYILSASGIYEVTPGTGVYMFGTPLFPEVKYHLENGKTFTIRANNSSPQNIYIKAARLNGEAYDQAFILHKDITDGSTLEFDMSDTPVKTAFKPTPPTSGNSGYVAVPIIGDGSRVFRQSLRVSVRDVTPGVRIHCTLDGSEPDERAMLCNSPFTITRNTRVRAIAIGYKGIKSQIAEATYNIIPNDWTVKIDSKYNRQYTGGGPEGLIDGIRGTTSLASGEWQGYQGQDFVATIDLQRQTQVSKVGGGFLQVARSWIWMPTHIEFEASIDGVNFTRVADIKTDIDPTDMNEQTRDYVQSITPVNARYIRVHAYNLGTIPAWHPGAGSQAFIFVDEILIN
ncbi:MAG: GH92 family glycosyl hydrolase [Acidobacteria bacterium]|nr:GH92 family glycosyl hydrolase [Acidobacteriota bacterium]